jgi:hypothetical protein
MFGARWNGSGRGFGAGGACILVVLGACVERARIVFREPPDGVGPVTVIDRPSQDTTVAAGPGFTVTGYSRDGDGVDTLYFETEGGVSSFPPLIGGSDSVRFGLPLTTLNQSGQTITVRVFGVDRLGNRGDTALRRVTVQ